MNSSDVTAAVMTLAWKTGKAAFLGIRSAVSKNNDSLSELEKEFRKDDAEDAKEEMREAFKELAGLARDFECDYCDAQNRVGEMTDYQLKRNAESSNLGMRKACIEEMQNRTNK